MPGLSGRALCVALRERRDMMPIVVVMSADEVFNSDQPVNARLRKPIDSAASQPRHHRRAARSAPDLGLPGARLPLHSCAPGSLIGTRLPVRCLVLIETVVESLQADAEDACGLRLRLPDVRCNVARISRRSTSAIVDPTTFPRVDSASLTGSATAGASDGAPSSRRQAVHVDHRAPRECRRSGRRS